MGGDAWKGCGEDEEVGGEVWRWERGAEGVDGDGVEGGGGGVGDRGVGCWWGWWWARGEREGEGDGAGKRWECCWPCGREGDAGCEAAERCEQGFAGESQSEGSEGEEDGEGWVRGMRGEEMSCRNHCWDDQGTDVQETIYILALSEEYSTHHQPHACINIRALCSILYFG